MSIDRSAFLYMEDADDDGDDFAQCSDCYAFTGSRCALLGVNVPPGASCGLFVDGKYDGLPIKRRSSPKEAGLVLEKVRCENCSYGGDTCALYHTLNRNFPQDFKLDEKIKPKACCNAFTPK